MRKWKVGALAALLCAGLAVSVAAADDDAAPPSKTSWWPGGWFAGKPKVDEKKSAHKLDSADDSGTAQRTAELQARAKNAYWRRLAACDRLREIAVQMQDPALEQKVERLNQQVFEAYLRRMSGGSGGHFETAEDFTETKAGKAKATQVGEDKP